MFHPELAASNTIAYVCLLGTFVLLAGVTFATFAIGISAWIKNTFSDADTAICSLHSHGNIDTG